MMGTWELRGLKAIEINGGDNSIELGTEGMELVVEIEGDEFFFCGVEPEAWWKELLHVDAVMLMCLFFLRG